MFSEIENKNPAMSDNMRDNCFDTEEKPIHHTKFRAIIIKDKICTKIKYKSFREAQAVLNCAKHPRKYDRGRKTRRLGKKDMRPQRSYRCEICGFWHLTSQSEWINDY